MNIEDIRFYALSKKEVEEGFLFGEEVLVFKVQGKMFLSVSLYSQPLRFNVKCDPERAIGLREQYASILPGYHMNKKHWNSVIADNTMTARLLKEQIDHSYDLVFKPNKPKKK